MVRGRTLAAVLGALALAAGPAGAQDVVPELPLFYTEKDPGAWLGDTARETEPWWWERIDERFADELRAGRTGAVLRALAEDVRGTDLPGAEVAWRRFRTQVERVVAAFDAAVLDAALGEGIDTVEQRSAVLAGLNARGVGSQSLEPQLLDLTGLGALALVFFADGPDEIASAELADGGWRLLVPPAAMQRLLLASHALSHVLHRFVDPIQDRQHDELVRVDAAWRNYLFEGYSQLPWESAFNGWVLDFDAFDPPDSQWILLHPSVGFALSTVSLDEIQANEVLNVELLGWLRYRGARNESYLGASLTATFRDDLGPGLGLMAHWRQGFSVGVAWHDEDDDDHFLDEDPFIYVSFDLYRWVQGELPEFRAKYGKVRDLLGRL